MRIEVRFRASRPGSEQKKEARDAVEMPNSDTVMQKVAAVDTGDIEKDLKSYLDPRYTGDTGQYDIPYSKEFGGTRSDGQPFTGNGYTGSAEHVIPEYVSNGTTPSSGEIYRVNPDGTEEAVAYYDPKEKVFSLYD